MAPHVGFEKGDEMGYNDSVARALPGTPTYDDETPISGTSSMGF